MNSREKVLVDRMLYRLKKEGIVDGFFEDQIIQVLGAARDLLNPEPALINVEAPTVIFGDTHGQFEDLMLFLEQLNVSDDTTLLFLGDYVDRGPKSLELMLYLLCSKLKNPKKYQLLRGNHECLTLNYVYGFYEECIRKQSLNVFNAFQEVFKELPLCASINRRILCMHGGLSKEIRDWHSLLLLEKPQSTNDLNKQLVQDLLWSDPDCFKGFRYNTERETSVYFGTDTIEELCRNLDIDLIVRAHECKQHGHEFIKSRKLCTLFSAPDYVKSGNSGSVMKITKNLEVSFHTIKPEIDYKRTEGDEEIDEKTPRTDICEDEEEFFEPQDYIIPYDIIQETSMESLSTPHE